MPVSKQTRKISNYLLDLDTFFASNTHVVPTTIVANDISRTDIGFNSDDNEVSWIDTDSTIVFSKRSKAQLARDLVAQIAIKINSTHLDQ